MKTIPALILATASIIAPVHGEVVSYDWNSGFLGGGLIPDGNITGWSDTRAFTDIPGGGILDVDVRIEIAGGFNGDYYAYLTHDSGISILLNRVGKHSGNVFGAFDSGLNITLDDSASLGDIHLYESTPDYAAHILDGSSWIPDGRAVNPLAVLDTDTPTNFLSEFNDLSANGSWTLFVADLSNGEVGSIESWGLTITTAPVPEATALWPALIIAAAIAARNLRNIRKPG